MSAILFFYQCSGNTVHESAKLTQINHRYSDFPPNMLLRYAMNNVITKTILHYMTILQANHLNSYYKTNEWFLIFVYNSVLNEHKSHLNL